MTYVTRYNPISDLRSLQARVLEPLFGRLNFLDDQSTSNVWAPAADLAEEADRIVVKVEVPGMKESDLKVNFEDGLLTVSGERQFEVKDDRTYHRVERAYGTFVRSFSLPRTVDAGSITASYRDGVLEIVIPKREESKPKQIQINVAKPTIQA